MRPFVNILYGTRCRQMNPDLRQPFDNRRADFEYPYDDRVELRSGKLRSPQRFLIERMNKSVGGAV